MRKFAQRHRGSLESSGLCKDHAASPPPASCSHMWHTVPVELVDLEGKDTDTEKYKFHVREELETDETELYEINLFDLTEISGFPCQRCFEKLMTKFVQDL
ncbi:hypothetical protein Anapl_05371 [Anas platyrhynchos]|uniref:Uncharacterized protein n=1 Tax=Anas platyrhynchos TaxID=8839 RepID=R0LP19_ANAPL|nr:hypothetical protein Anapl_05371 [Anas platyrhynchos]